MGWTPSGKKQAASVPEPVASPTPSPRRRRRMPDKQAAEAAAFPNTTAAKAATSDPAPSPSRRPPGGTHRDKLARRDQQERELPTQISVRLGQRWSQVITEIKRGDYTWKQFTEDLTEEELARGQLLDEDGLFRGRPPSFVPREFHLACQREMKRRFEEIFSESVLDLTRQYVEIARDTSIPGAQRAKIIQYAMERLFGGVPKEIQVTQEKAWEQVLVNVTNSDAEVDMPEWRARRYAGYAERQTTEGMSEDDEGETNE